MDETDRQNKDGRRRSQNWECGKLTATRSGHMGRVCPVPIMAVGLLLAAHRGLVPCGFLNSK
jgi:hypothetical protein